MLVFGPRVIISAGAKRVNGARPSHLSSVCSHATVDSVPLLPIQHIRRGCGAKSSMLAQERKAASRYTHLLKQSLFRRLQRHSLSMKERFPGLIYYKEINIISRLVLLLPTYFREAQLRFKFNLIYYCETILVTFLPS